MEIVRQFRFHFEYSMLIIDQFTKRDGGDSSSDSVWPDNVKRKRVRMLNDGEKISHHEI